MAAKTTVEQLANEAGLDLDEALVTLWDIGIESVGSASDTVPSSGLQRARSALGLASKSELQSVRYWCNRLDLDDTGLRELLLKADLHLAPGARTLPKRGVAFMRKHERSGDAVVMIATPRASERIAPAAVVAPPYKWKAIGKVKDLRFLGPEEVRGIHQQLFEDFLSSDNPIDTPGTRSDDLLESACSRPMTGSGGVLKYPTVEMAASALAHSIVNNHPFWNGNKRTALVSFLVFLDEHGLLPTCSDDELFRFMLKVSQHRLVPREWPDRADREVLEMALWVRSNTRAVTKGERPVKWHRLRRILADYGCVCEQAKNTGNRMNISREIEVKGPLGVGRRRKVLATQVAYGDEGREADHVALRTIRSKLQLDEEHGVDSAAFYEGDSRTVGEFILEYRRVLRRLAKL